MGPSVEKRAARRRIAIACNPCRERKSRCDGAKPMCSTCQRRSFPLSHCIYHLDNAATQSNDAYISSLHERIRQLEDKASSNATTSGETMHTDGSTRGRNTVSVESNTPGSLPRSEAQAADIVMMSGLETLADTTTSEMQMPHATVNQLVTAPSPARENMTAVFPVSHSGAQYSQHESADPGSVTGMGDIASGIENETIKESGKDYYGTSSTASLMHITHSSVQSKRSPNSHSSPSIMSSASAKIRPNPSRHQKSMRADLAAEVCLPSRTLADLLLDRYWERVHSLYPFVHRPSFQAAYERLWQSSGPFKAPLSDLDVGLGGSADSGPDSAAFHAALNVMFAMGCHFSDMPPSESAAMAQNFFLRSKKFVGLEFLDENNLGVVQALLIRVLFLQSTPFSNRCWISVGLACRIAQGIGLHTDYAAPSLWFWEIEMRRRVWHGCVMMDRIVSMTLGRPVMISHPFNVPSPSALEEDQTPLPDLSTTIIPGTHSRMLFYVKAIELCEISERVLSTVYQPWLNESSSTSSKDHLTWKRFGSMDAIMELEMELATFESSLPRCFSWTQSDVSQANLEAGMQVTYQRQKNVLNSRFLHLRLMLYRPILIKMCQERSLNSINTGPTPFWSNSFGPKTYSDFVTKCACSCVTAAQNLVELIHSNYLTQTTGAWWYNGLYASTAGLILTLARICPPLFDSLDSVQLQESFKLCENVLGNLASFSISAHNTLGLLRKMNRELDNEQSQLASDSQNTACSAPFQTTAAGYAEGTSVYPNVNAESFGDSLGGLSAIHSSFFGWDSALELMPDDLYAIMSAPVTPPAWDSENC